MWPLSQRKPFFLTIGILSILLLALLAASMDTLQFKKGTPFSYVETRQEQSRESPTLMNMNWLIIVEIVVFGIMIIIALVFATPKLRRIILLTLLVIGLALVGIMWWIFHGGSGIKAPSPTATVVQTPVEPVETLVPTAQETPVIYLLPKISPWISITITFFALFGITLLVWFFLQYRLRDTVPLGELAGIAGQTVSDLQAGMDYGDAILNCYAAMVEVVKKQRDIRRRGSLTPAEFVAVLERARLPSVPVRRLTTLFEQVRYGGNKSSRKEIDEAVTCLNEIVAACQEVQ